MLPFPMARSIPDKTHYIARPDHHHSLSTAHYPLFSTLCFHHFANPSSRLPANIDFYFHHFHALTNCLFRKSFALINICVAPWCFSREFVTFRYSHLRTSQVLYIHTIASSLSSPKNSSALESVTSTLFSKNTRGMGAPGRFLRTQAWTAGVTRVGKIGESPALWEGQHRRCG